MAMTLKDFDGPHIDINSSRSCRLQQAGGASAAKEEKTD